jgi:hypothetical protein
VCRSNLSLANASYLRSFCHGLCGTRHGHGHTHCVNPRWAAPRVVLHLEREACPSYAHVDYEAELSDMVRDTRRLSHTAYLDAARSHRFCVVAPGDFLSTHKISETLAIGGTGGCIPVFVLPTTRPTLENAIADVLPFSRWLDYCSVAYFVREAQARTRFRRVLAKLERVDEATAAAKLAALALVRDAFVFRPNSSLDDPSAAEYVLNEVCATARRFGRHGEAVTPHRPTRDRLAGGTHRSCLLA